MQKEKLWDGEKSEENYSRLHRSSSGQGGSSRAIADIGSHWCDTTRAMEKVYPLAK